MHYSFLLLLLSLGALVKCDAGSDWCYNECEHTPSHWSSLPDSFCGGNRQSPIDIVTRNVWTDSNLQEFTFTNFSSQYVIRSIENNGHTVKCNLKNNWVEVSGGGLNGIYSTIQFHFHWGDTEHHPGSEHTIDGHRYPMEMHIVSLKKGLDVSEATENPEGIAVLGFFINVTDDGIMSEPWEQLTSLLIKNADSPISPNLNISIDDLIGDIDLTMFYRYMGSLTTPKCNEAVVWTLFYEPINIHKDLIERFPMKTELKNVYRPVQQLNMRDVYASPATPLPPAHDWCYDGHCEGSGYKPSLWPLLSHSHCGGEHQSPINIVTRSTVIDENLDAFIFTKFDDKHAIDSIVNTGHAVKCILKDDTVEVSGGGLGHVYSTLQFHFHWGAMSHESPGSEHTVDSKRYPMEMHIVNKRKDLTLTEALKTPNGLAVLGVFIEAKETKRSSGGSSGNEETHPTPSPSDEGAWTKLTKRLSFIKDKNAPYTFTEELSIDDLLGSLNRATYYRYNGSLTTPTCNEAVVWTVFKESIKVDQSLIMLFPEKMEYHDVFRPAQLLHNRTIYSTKAAASAPGPVLLFLLLACLFALAFNFHQ